MCGRRRIQAPVPKLPHGKSPLLPWGSWRRMLLTRRTPSQMSWAMTISIQTTRASPEPAHSPRSPWPAALSRCPSSSSATCRAPVWSKPLEARCSGLAPRRNSCLLVRLYLMTVTTSYVYIQRPRGLALRTCCAIHMSTSLGHLCMYTYMDTCVHMYVCVRMYICICTHTDTYIRIYRSICIHKHTYL